MQGAATQAIQKEGIAEEPQRSSGAARRRAARCRRNPKERHGRWKLIRHPKVNKTQLFDLQTDPNETNDLSTNPAQAGRVKELLALMAEQQKLFGDAAPLSVPDPAPAEVTLEFFQHAKAAPKDAAKRAE